MPCGRRRARPDKTMRDPPTFMGDRVLAYFLALSLSSVRAHPKKLSETESPKPKVPMYLPRL